MNSENPYESPTQFDVDVARAKSLVLIPAILLLAVASLSILLAIFAGFIIVFDTIRILDYHGGVAGLPHVLPAILSFTALCISYFLVLYGAMQMLKGRRFGMARTAAILSVIPVCSPLFVIGIPFGIWALVLLSKPEVRSAFERSAAQQ